MITARISRCLAQERYVVGDGAEESFRQNLELCKRGVCRVELANCKFRIVSLVKT